MNSTNPFKQLEPDVHCPPELKEKIVSEIDLIRNVLQIVDVYAYDIFPAFTTFVSGLIPDEEK